MKKKIRISMALVLGLGLLICTVAAAFVFEARFTSRAKEDMQRLVSSVALSAQSTGRDAAAAKQLSDSTGGLRVTFVDEDGVVTGDSVADPATMENHADREEIVTARVAKYGISVRRSETTGSNMLYVATRLSDGSYLRVSGQYPSALAGFVSFLPATLAAAVVAYLIALVLADRFARSISGPIEELCSGLKSVRGGTVRLDPARYPYDELQEMAADINELSEDVDRSIKTLSEERARIDYVLDNMTEGLILLDGQEQVLTINRAACGFLGCDKSVTGKNIIYATRQMALIEAVDGAVHSAAAGRVELPLSSGLLIDAAVSPVVRAEGDGEMAEAAIVVLSDVTIRRNAARMKQEFFSNASHELKTPITSIRGFAELLCAAPDLEPEKRQEYARRILREAGTMQNLISDIIMISRLESGDITFEREVLDLADVVRDCCANAKPAAEENGTTLTCAAERAVISASRKEMQELAGNLIQNAVRYNGAGGYIDVNLTADDEKIVLSVHNTNSYIEPQYQQRVFERFYRIDKGRSKAMGGTGLGLAIVKHVAGQYGAKVELTSTKEDGTTFTVTFPREKGAAAH